VVSNSGAIVGELLAKSARTAGEVAGIGVTGMLPAVVLLDADAGSFPPRPAAERRPRHR
jgi:sugar (pentulose or hexulose) kinase